MENLLDMARLSDATTHQVTTFNPKTGDKTLPVPRGARVTVLQVQGPGVIANLWLTFPGWFWQYWNNSAPVSPTLLKTLILRLYWDGASVPAVQAPVGDFFGCGLCESVSFASRYLGISSGGFYCKFPMPFHNGFRLEIENLDPVCDTEIFANVLFQVTPDSASLQDAGYFHTQFNSGVNPGSVPLPIVRAAGRGHYTGCTLSVQGKDRGYLCFLEAPEYAFVDEDWDGPRIVGTGMEDYFLGGWYFRDGPFTGPLHGVTAKDALNSSVAMYRIHELDAIHFRKRFRLEFINPWRAEDLWEFAYSSAGFFYLDSPLGQQGELPSIDRLLCWYRIKETDHISNP